MNVNKKILIAAFVHIIALGSAIAQRPVGDTIIGATDSTYFYYDYDDCYNSVYGYDTSYTFDWYRGWSCTTTDYFAITFTPVLGTSINSIWTGPFYGTSATEPQTYGNDIRGVQMYTSRLLKVVGIAACGYAQAPRDTNYGGTFFFPNTRDTTLAGRLTDSLILYRVTPNGPEYMAGGPWRVEYPHRYLRLPPRMTKVLYYGQAYVLDSAPTVPLYEVMFDKPQLVTDSFIVAGTCNNNDGSYETQWFTETYGDRMWLWNHPPTRYWSLMYIDTTYPLNFYQYFTWYKYRTAPWVRTSNGSGSITIFPIVPIIEPNFDTILCDVVSNVHLADKTDSSLTLMWNGGNNVEWEVEYAEEGEATTHTVTVTAPMATLTGLRPNTKYLAHVRGRCDAGVEYGEWSEIIEVRTEQYHPQEEKIDDLDRFTQMMPNPARGEVTVISSYRLSRVVVYDLQGHSVIEQEGEGLATAFDVGRLAKGVYVVAIHTPAGIATKRLVVE